MDKHTKKILQDQLFPICVTQPLPMEELTSWKKQLDDQKVCYELRERRPGRFAIYREVTAEEREELENGEWVIRGNSFFQPDDAQTRPRANDR